MQVKAIHSHLAILTVKDRQHIAAVHITVNGIVEVGGCQIAQILSVPFNSFLIPWAIEIVVAW